MSQSHSSDGDQPATAAAAAAAAASPAPSFSSTSPPATPPTSQPATHPTGTAGGRAPSRPRSKRGKKNKPPNTPHADNSTNDMIKMMMAQMNLHQQQHAEQRRLERDEQRAEREADRREREAERDRLAHERERLLADVRREQDRMLAEHQRQLQAVNDRLDEAERMTKATCTANDTVKTTDADEMKLTSAQIKHASRRLPECERGDWLAHYQNIRLVKNRKFADQVDIAQIFLAALHADDQLRVYAASAEADITSMAELLVYANVQAKAHVREALRNPIKGDTTSFTEWITSYLTTCEVAANMTGLVVPDKATQMETLVAHLDPAHPLYGSFVMSPKDSLAKFLELAQLADSIEPQLAATHLDKNAIQINSISGKSRSSTSIFKPKASVDKTFTDSTPDDVDVDAAPGQQRAYTCLMHGANSTHETGDCYGIKNLIKAAANTGNNPGRSLYDEARRRKPLHLWRCSRCGAHGQHYDEDCPTTKKSPTEKDTSDAMKSSNQYIASTTHARTPAPAAREPHTKPITTHKDTHVHSTHVSYADAARANARGKQHQSSQLNLDVGSVPCMSVVLSNGPDQHRAQTTSIKGAFLADSGANVVVITHALAKALRLNLIKLPANSTRSARQPATHVSTMADGSSLTATHLARLYIKVPGVAKPARITALVVPHLQKHACILGTPLFAKTDIFISPGREKYITPDGSTYDMMPGAAATPCNNNELESAHAGPEPEATEYVHVINVNWFSIASTQQPRAAINSTQYKHVYKPAHANVSGTDTVHVASLNTATAPKEPPHADVSAAAKPDTFYNEDAFNMFSPVATTQQRDARSNPHYHMAISDMSPASSSTRATATRKDPYAHATICSIQLSGNEAPPLASTVHTNDEGQTTPVTSIGTRTASVNGTGRGLSDELRNEVAHGEPDPPIWPLV